jgi:site-specific DNA recombinase
MARSAPRARRNVRTVASYARRSKEKDTLGIALQLRHCRERADEEGWRVLEFSDDGRSGWDPRVRREGYETMLDAIRAGKSDAVLIYKADRLHRDDRERRRFEDVFEEAGLWLVALANGKRFDLKTADGKKDFREAGIAAEYYSDQLSERLSDHHAYLAGEGRDSGGPRPFGFEPDRVTVREVEAELIREAARRFVGGESLRAIAADWNGRGLVTAQGAAWRPSHVRKTISSARSAGLREHHGRVVAEATWPAIVDKRMRDLILSILDDPHRRTAHSTARKYVLTGLVFCGACERRLYSARRNDGGRHYRCDSGPNRGGCGRVSIAAGPLEEHVCERAYSAWESRILAEANRVEGKTRRRLRSRADDETPKVLAEVEALEERLASLGRLYAEGSVGEEEFVSASQRLRERLEDLRTELGRAAARRGPGHRWVLDPDFQIVPPWETDEPDVKVLEDLRSLVAEVVTRVQIAPATKRGGRFDRSRVEIIWR